MVKENFSAKSDTLELLLANKGKKTNFAGK